MREVTTYCGEEGCPKEAVGSRPLGVTGDGTPVVELVCEEHESRVVREALGGSDA